MKKIIFQIFLFGAVCFFAGPMFAQPPVRVASEMAPPPDDPKKKKAGDECQTSDECQVHHACKKSGDKNVCTAPPRPKYKPGVVT